MRTSVLVPVGSDHIQHVSTLLATLGEQSVAPDEVVVAISGADRSPFSEPTGLPFEVVILADSKPAFAGANRNRAARASSGNILIYQDVDDVPHPQRVEIVRALFARSPIDHLEHFFARAERPADLEAWSRRFALKDVIAKSVRFGVPFARSGIHPGQIATTRQVFDRLRWDENMQRGQDAEYCRRIYADFPSHAHVQVPLVLYRKYLSHDPRFRNYGRRGPTRS